MKKTITFTQLQKLVKEATHKELIGERNDDDPVTLSDVPEELLRYLKDFFRATVHDNKMMPLPYLYVTIPLNADNSRSGKKLTTGLLNQLERKVARCGWHIIEKFEPFEECPDYTILISPYRNPHEPGSDEFDRTINKQRKAQADREAEYLSMDGVDEGFEVADEVTEGRDLDFPLINQQLAKIQDNVKECKMKLQDLYRDARYGKTPATKQRRQDIMVLMHELREAAHDIFEMMKD